MNEIFKKNIESIQNHLPHVWDWIKDAYEKFEKSPDGADGEKFTWINSANGPVNFIYSKGGLAPRPYHSPQAMQDAYDLIEKTDIKHAGTVFIFGMGAGYLLKAFSEKRYSKNFAVLLVEKSPHIYLRGLCLFDFTPLFEDKTVDFIVSDNIPVVKMYMSAFFQNNTTVGQTIKILPTKTAIETEATFYEEVARQMLDSRDHATIRAGNSVPDGMMGWENYLQNIIPALKMPGVKPLEGQCKGKVCISLAAGPDANKHIDKLKALQGRVPIFACDTLLKPLTDRGIAADFITAIERVDYIIKFFNGMTIPDRSALAGPMLLWPDAVKAYKGTHLLYAPLPGYSGPFGTDILGKFPVGSSAGNLNIALATYFGFDTIILVGHNLAYGFGTHETHLAGTIESDRERGRSLEELQFETRGLQTGSQDGKDQVWTRFEWLLFKRQIEDVIANHQDKNWINTSPKGAHIMGTELMDFDEAIAKYVKEDFDIYPVRTKLCAPIPQDEYETRLQFAHDRAEEISENVWGWDEKGNEILKKIKKWRKKIEDKELEGKQVSIDFLNKCLDDVLSVKVEAVNKDLIFVQIVISIILPAHVTFERTMNEMPGKYDNDYKLKRDFLLAHEQYYSIWKKFLPDIAKALDKFIDESERVLNVKNTQNSSIA